MGMLERFFTAAARKALEYGFVQLPTSGSPLFLSLPRLPDERNYESKVGDGTGNSIVVACLNWIATNFIEAPPAVWQKSGGTKELLDTHTLLELLEAPNPYFTGVELFMATVVDWNMGNAYWIKRRSQAGRVVELWWAPRWMITPKGVDGTADSTKFITHYEYRPGGLYQEIPAADVVHFRQGIDPLNPRMGRSKLYGLLREVYTDEEAARFTAAILHNLGVPGIVVAPRSGAGTPQEGDAQEIKKRFMEDFSGDKRGEPIVMTGPTEVTQFGFSPEQLKLGDIRDVPEERVTAALNLPAAVVGFGAGLQSTKVGATMSELRDQAWQNNLIPTQRVIGAKIKQSLLPEFEGASARRAKLIVGFDTSEVAIMADHRAKLAEVDERYLRAGGVRRSEVRRRLGLPVGPRDEVYLLNAGVVEVDATKAPDRAPAPANGAQAGAPAAEPPVAPPAPGQEAA